MLGERLTRQGPRQLELSGVQCHAMEKLEWEPLRGQTSLQNIVLKAAVLNQAALHKLAMLLAEPSELKALQSLELGGVPVSCNAEAARSIAMATATLHTLRLIDPVRAYTQCLTSCSTRFSVIFPRVLRAAAWA